MLLLVAAAEPLGDPGLVWRAAERLGVTPEMALAGGTDGLLSIDERVTFRHPLVRSAVYQAAEAGDRRAAHLALAEVTDQQVDPDRRAWHLAAAVVGPDESVAGELEQSAGRAQARGGLAAAAAFLQRAVAISEDTARRADRALAAAGASLHAGDVEAAQRFLDTADRDARDEWQAARIQLVRGQMAFATGMGRDAPPLLLGAAERLEAFDMDLARETYLTAWGAAVVAGEQDSLLTISRAIGQLPEPAGTPRPIDVLLRGYALLGTGGRAAAVPALERAASILADFNPEDILKWGWVATGVGPTIWDDGVMRAMFARQVEVARDAGALTDLSLYLVSLGLVTAWTGDFATAQAISAEADLVSAATGSPVTPNAALRLGALRGREGEASALIASALQQAGATGQGMGVTVAHWSAAVLYNGLARYDQALAAAQASTQIAEPWISLWALPELIEAATRVGEDELARAALERLLDATQPCSTDWALGTSARARALVERRSPRPTTSTVRRSSGSAGRSCGPSWPALTSCTASGCVGRVGASTREGSCARRTTCSSPSAWRRSRSERAAS